MIGELKIIELRDKAKKALGDKFSASSTTPCSASAPCRSTCSRSRWTRTSRPRPLRRPCRRGRAWCPSITSRTTARCSCPARRGSSTCKSRPATSWYHTHADPILYVIFSNGTLRTQPIGEDWGGGGRGRGNANAEGGAPPGRGNQPSGPAVRVTSTTSYFEQPVTHRVRNVGDQLFHVVGVTSATAGDTSATESGAGFPGKPELTNRWFRSYRFTLAPGQSSGSHRHAVPSVIVQTSDGSMKFDLNESGRWAFFDAADSHDVKNTGDAPVEFVEVEVRR